METDPRFTNQRTWLNSDYLLSQLLLDAAGMQQRIGDGFYEQWLIREQVSQLTDRRLENYSDDEAQYRALMEAGVTLAQGWNLRPGVALSAEQLAQLTSDIVWLVEETVRLPDGTLTTALVPKVYLVPREGDLDGNGTLISAESVDLRLEGDLVNSGTIAGRSVVQLSGDNLRNLGGRISGADVLMQARTDLENLGGRIDAQDSLLLSAGRDLTVAGTTQSNYEQAGKSDFSRTNLDRVAGLYVSSPGGTLAVAAGRDVTLTGAEVTNAGAGGQTLISAGRDLTLATVQTSEQENIVADANNYLRMGETREVGTRVQTTGDLILTAGNDLNARAAQISSEAGAVLLNAGNDVNLTAGEETHNFSEAHKRKHSGLFGSTTTTSRYSEEERLALGTSVSGHTVQVQAGNDLTLEGGSLVSDQGTVLVAGNDVNILAAQNSYSQSQHEKEKKSGVIQSGAAVTVGKQMQSADSQQSGTYATASTVGSLGGDVTIQAGGDYRQVGSHVVAPGGDIAIRAERVEIVEARETSQSVNESKFRQSGVTAAVSSPVISALQTADQMKQASSRTDDRRLQALAAVTTGLSVSNAASAVGADPAALGGLNISITAGSSKSDSRTETRSDTAAGSTVSAGGNVRIVASGAGQDSDLTIRGGAVTAGGDVLLKAEGDIALLAARNSSEMERESSSSSVGAGVAVNVGSNGASYGLTANASASKGDGESQDITWTHTQISAGNRLTLESGGDTTLRGALASSEQVVAEIGGNLAIESLQDIHTFRSKDQSIGGSVTVGGGASASLNVGQQKIDSDYASVTEQSGIKAGDGGFDIRVEGNTDLKGAVIASNQSAIDAGLNRLDTGTLTHSDILNRAEYDATSLSLGFGYSSSGSGVGTDQQGNAQTGAEQTPGSTLPSNGGFSATTPVAMKAGDSDSSTTHSGVSGGVLTIRDADGQGTLANLKRDVNSEQDGSNALKPIFDQQEIETAFEITKAFVQESGAFLQRKSAETASAQQALDEEQKKPAGEQNQARIAELQQTVDDNATWEMGGAGRLLLTALSAGAGGNVTGGTGEMLQATAVNFAQGLAAQGVKLVAGDDDATRALLHGMVGCLGAAGQGGDCGSGALGGSGAVALNLLLDQMQGVNGSELTATEKEARSNLVASLLAGAAAAAGGDAGTVGTAGKLETENNAVWFAAAALSSEALAALGLGAAAGGAAAVALNDEGTQQALQGAGEATASAMDTSLEIWKLLGIALGFPITELGNNSTTSPGENITNLDGTNTEMGQGVRSIYPTIPVVIRLWKMDLGVRSCLWLIRCQD